MMGIRKVSRSNAAMFGSESGSDGYKDDSEMAGESENVSVYEWSIAEHYAKHGRSERSFTFERPLPAQSMVCGSELVWYII